MANSILKELLTEYEASRLHAIKTADNIKSELYKKYPELQKIDDELSKISIQTAKSILANNNPILLENLKSSVNELKKRKHDLFISLNIDECCLLPKFKCSVCEDTGFVSSYNENVNLEKKYKNNYANGNTVMCNCLKQRLFDISYNKSNVGNIKNDNFSNFNLDFYSNEVNEKLYKTNVSPRQNIEAILNIVLSFVNNFENPNEKNLLFRGNTGLGKTFLSNCIANEILGIGKTVLYQTAPVMLDMILDYRFGKSVNNKNICDSLLNVDLLIIDDLGTEHMNSLKFAELFNIINSRILNQNNKVTKTIISTNLTMNQLFATYDERIVSRFVGNYNILPFFGEDIRFKKENIK